MKNNRNRKIAGLVIDLAMYLLLLVQLLYVFTGNDAHEWLGIGFFVFLVLHLVLKRTWFSVFYKRKGRVFSGRRFADLLILLLVLSLGALMVSSMGVSRTIFPQADLCGDPELHRFLATAALTFAFLHGGMHGYLTSKKKRKIVIGMVIASLLPICLGAWMVPYLNRHFRTVEISLEEAVSGEQLQWNAGTPLVVYFTRVGNTEFEADIDAVSGASLLRADGELMGNTQLLAEMLQDILCCDARAITLTEGEYPSSYAETCAVAGKELKAKTYPGIEPIDVSGCDSVLLVYPLWWNTLPMPVVSFLKDNSFENKTVYLIATQGSHGFGTSTKDAKELIPSANVTEAISVYCDDIPEARGLLTEWIVSNHLGQVSE